MLYRYFKIMNLHRLVDIPFLDHPSLERSRWSEDLIHYYEHGSQPPQIHSDERLISACAHLSAGAILLLISIISLLENKEAESFTFKSHRVNSKASLLDFATEQYVMEVERQLLSSIHTSNLVKKKKMGIYLGTTEVFDSSSIMDKYEIAGFSDPHYADRNLMKLLPFYINRNS